MSSNAIYIAFFLVPVGAALVTNMAVLAIVIFKVVRIDPRPPLFGQARGWLSLIILLGGTWLVGIAAKAAPSATWLAVAFVVLNSLQVRSRGTQLLYSALG